MPGASRQGQKQVQSRVWKRSLVALSQGAIRCRIRRVTGPVPARRQGSTDAIVGREKETLQWVDRTMGAMRRGVSKKA